MQKILFLLCLFFSSLASFSQKDALTKFEKERISYTKRSMLVLGGWSAANIIVSGFATNTSNREMRYFHQMNVMWGSINLAIAGLSYWGSGKEKINNPTLSDVLKHQNKIEKTYIINEGLDVIYIAGGFFMNQKSDNQKNPEKFKGYGNSIMLQGGFLLVYDAINYAIHHKHGKQLKGQAQKLGLNGGPGSIFLTYTF